MGKVMNIYLKIFLEIDIACFRYSLFSGGADGFLGDGLKKKGRAKPTVLLPHLL